MKKKRLLPVICIVVAALMVLGVLLYSVLSGSPSLFPVSSLHLGSRSAVSVPILMFHEIRQVEGGTWAVSAENFRATIELLLEKGFTPITFDTLINFVDGKGDIPEKPVCITLDDGYYSAYETLLPIVTELKVPVTVFMNGRTVRAPDELPSRNPDILSKMSSAELKVLEASPYVSVQSHTYGLHSQNTLYSDEKRDNVLPLEGESKSDYQSIFNRDCAASEEFLEGIGVNQNLVFSYPGGKYHEWSEEVLRERGYRVSLTTDFSHRNVVISGSPESLYLLGRMNVNDETTEAQLLRYLERK